MFVEILFIYLFIYLFKWVFLRGESFFEKADVVGKWIFFNLISYNIYLFIYLFILFYFIYLFFLFFFWFVCLFSHASQHLKYTRINTSEHLRCSLTCTWIPIFIRFITVHMYITLALKKRFWLLSYIFLGHCWVPFCHLFILCINFFI